MKHILVDEAAEEMKHHGLAFSEEKDHFQVLLMTELSEELKKEGEAREIIRNVQKLRKEQNLTLNDAIELTLPTWPKEHEDFIKKSTHASSITEGTEMTIKVVSLSFPRTRESN